MKKILVVLTSVIMMYGCIGQVTEENSTDNKVRNGALVFSTYKYNGHTYIHRTDSYFLHDPDCKCRISNNGLSNEE